MPAAIAAITSGSVLPWQVLQTKVPPAVGVRPLCSTVIEASWHGVQLVTSAGVWMSDGVPGWPQSSSWQAAHGWSCSSRALPRAWQVSQST